MARTACGEVHRSDVRLLQCGAGTVAQAEHEPVTDDPRAHFPWSMEQIAPNILRSLNPGSAWSSSRTRSASCSSYAIAAENTGGSTEKPRQATGLARRRPGARLEDSRGRNLPLRAEGGDPGPDKPAGFNTGHLTTNDNLALSWSGGAPARSIRAAAGSDPAPRHRPRTGTRVAEPPATARQTPPRTSSARCLRLLANRRVRLPQSYKRSGSTVDRSIRSAISIRRGCSSRKTRRPTVSAGTHRRRDSQGRDGQCPQRASLASADPAPVDAWPPESRSRRCDRRARGRLGCAHGHPSSPEG